MKAVVSPHVLVRRRKPQCDAQKAQQKKKKRTETISIVGSGRLGTALAKALSSAGYPIQAVVARRFEQARKAAAFIGRPTLALAAHELNLLPPSTIVLITTPDDEMAGTAQRLAISQREPARGRTVLHTSGALSSAILAPLAETGFQVGSLHPLVSVNDPRTGSENLRGAFFCVEGDTAAARVARIIVRDLGGESFRIPSGSKPLYHAAAVMASPHVVALFDLAMEMLVQCGLNERNARRVLLPLLDSTVNNLRTFDPAHAITGTFARGDLATVQRHLQALSTAALTDALAAYRILGARSLKLAKNNAIHPQRLKQMRQALAAQATKKK